MPFTEWSVPDANPAALAFHDPQAGQTVLVPRSAGLEPAMRINAALGEHPLAGLHPDFPRTSKGRAEERAYEQGQASALVNAPGFDAPAPLATSEGALASNGNAFASLPPETFASVVPNAGPTAPVDASVAPLVAAAQGRASAAPAPPRNAPPPPTEPSGPVVMSSAGQGGPSGQPGADGSPASAQGNLAATLYHQAALNALRGTYVAPSAGGTFQTAEQRQGAMPLTDEQKNAYFGAERAASDATLARTEAENALKGQQAQSAAQLTGYYTGQQELVRAQGMQRAEKIQAAQAALADELTRDKVDPSSFWADKGTANKIGAGVALFLGALGGSRGANAGRNTAAEALDQAVTQHIDAQKANLAKKQGQLSALGQMYQQTLSATGDRVAAFESAKAAGLDQAAKQAEAMALQSGSPVYLARAKEARSMADAQMARAQFQLDQAEAGQRTQHLVVRQASPGGWTGPNAAKAAELEGKGASLQGTIAKDQATAAKDARQAAPGTFVMNGRRYAMTESTVTPEQAGKIRSAATAIDNLHFLLGEAEKASTSIADNTVRRSKLQALSEQVARAMSKMQEEGITRQEDVDLAKNAVLSLSSGGREVYRSIVDRTAQGLIQQNQAQPVGPAR